MQHKSQTWPFIVPMIPSPVSQSPCSHTHPRPCLLGFRQASVCPLSLLTGTPWLIGTAPSIMEQGLGMLVQVRSNSAGACQPETGVMSASPLTAECFEKISLWDRRVWSVKGKKNNLPTLQGCGYGLKMINTKANELLCIEQILQMRLLTVKVPSL